MPCGLGVGRSAVVEHPSWSPEATQDKQLCPLQIRALMREHAATPAPTPFPPRTPAGDTAVGLTHFVGTANYKQNGNQTYLLPFPAAHFLVFLLQILLFLEQF